MSDMPESEADYYYRSDIYPGDRPVDQGAHPADGLIFHDMFKTIAARGKGESTDDPDAQVSHNARKVFGKFHELGIDWQRIRVGAALAQIDLSRGMVQTIDSGSEDSRAEA